MRSTRLGCLFFFWASAGLFAQPIQLVLDGITVDSESITGPACLQVPVYIVDPGQNRDLILLSFALDITGDVHLIEGGVAGDLVILNSFTGVADPAGIRDPGVPLVNQANGFTQPNCGASAIFNPATQGSGAAADFFSGTGAGGWALNNNRDGIGRKFALALNLGGNSMGQTLAGQRLLVGVIVLPIAANPGAARITIRAVPEADLPSGNAFSWIRPTKTGELPDEGGFLSDLMDVSRAEAVVDILEGGQPVPALGPFGVAGLLTLLCAAAISIRRRGKPAS